MQPCRRPDLDSLRRASSNSTLPVTLVGKDLNKAGDDAIDVSVEALKAPDSKITPLLIPRNRHIGTHGHKAVIHLHHAVYQQ